jgi:hypothetical protein
MSLLGTPVYANPSTPLWASASGGAITGNLNVTGQVTATGGFSGRPYVVTDLSGNTGMLLSATAPGISYIQTQNNLRFGQIGQGTTNTSLTVSAPGANADVLTVGGQINGGGITPLTSVVGAATIANGTPTSLTITPAISLVSGGIYDIQVSGYWATGVTATPATADVASVILTTGTGTVPTLLKYQYTDNQYPAFADDPWTPGTNHPFHIRARMPCNNTQALALTGSFTATGTYTGNSLGLVVSDLTVVRVA